MRFKVHSDLHYEYLVAVAEKQNTVHTNQLREGLSEMGLIHIVKWLLFLFGESSQIILH